MSYNLDMPTDLGVLTSMITPAVLISACAGLILSTSVRLGRVVDRVRSLSEKFEELTQKSPADVVLFEATLALRSIHAKMDFLWTLGKHHAPMPLRDRIPSRRAWLERFR